MIDKQFWAKHSWFNGQWRTGVCLTANDQGIWSDIATGVHTPPPDSIVLSGPALPGMINAHSHTFQRAFAGLSERRDNAADDFWSWRDRMYDVALRITSDELRAIAAQLYIELIKGGYTQLCEFHYLHHAQNGQPFDDPATLSRVLADAATEAGIGLTLLPALYERAGFAQSGLRDDQRRFSGAPKLIHSIHRDFQSFGGALINAGVAIHSLRAASKKSIAELVQLVGDDDVPIHLHIAEQTREVDECLAVTGLRPIELLYRDFNPDSRWQLIHATHATPDEIDTVARSGAGIVICPTTEANLGDGVIDLPAWLAAKVPMAIGSDSHVSRSWAEELRWLEYVQRLVFQRRNVTAAPETGQPSTAARLFDTALCGGQHAAGATRWGFVKGARADMLILDTRSPGLLGIPPSHILDALVFASSESVVRDVFIAGKQVVINGEHPREKQIAKRFAEVMASLWSHPHAIALQDGPGSSR